MSEEKKEVSLVPVDRVNIENAAAVTGGIVGFFLAGPIAGLILAAISNYAAKKDNESGEALRGFGKTVVESYNFIAKLNAKYSISDKVTDSVSKAVSSIETESDSLEAVKKTVSSTVSKVDELNKEYDFVGKAKQAAAAAAVLSDSALEKVEELNAKVRFLSCYYPFLHLNRFYTTST